jgi:hypothetical protein
VSPIPRRQATAASAPEVARGPIPRGRSKRRDRPAPVATHPPFVAPEERQDRWEHLPSPGRQAAQLARLQAWAAPSRAREQPPATQDPPRPGGKEQDLAHEPAPASSG